MVCSFEIKEKQRWSDQNRLLFFIHSGYILATPDSTLHHQKKLHSDWCVSMVQSRVMPRG